MNRQRARGLVLSVTLLVCAALAGTATAGEWPARWTVNGNGTTGVLEISVREDGSMMGRLMDGYVEGYVSGRHLFIRRTVGNRTEVWEGWLGSPDAGASLIIAGTISVEQAGKTIVYPWFATPEASEPVSSVTVPPAEPPPPVPVPSAAPAAEPTPVAPDGGPLSGTWKSTTGGSAEIFQEGKTIMVTLADGSTHAGRVTGDSTLVVGLRKGCCNGELQGPDVIMWSDGVRWTRADRP